MYATRASRSGFVRSGYASITGLRSAFIFTVISLGVTIQARISSTVSLVPTSSSGPLTLPFPAIEWHTEHLRSAYTLIPCASLSCANAGAVNTTKTPAAAATAIDTRPLIKTS